jgi:signal transduction histidine kinase
MDALIESAHLGLGQIDANGTITALNAEFARLFRIGLDDAREKSVTELPPPVNECWSQIVRSAGEPPGIRRWNIHVGEPPDRRALEVVGWAARPEDGDPVVHLLVSEAADVVSQSLNGVAERARLAREIHDGLAQDLWLAKLTAAKLARHPTLDSDARAMCDDLIRSIDSGLAEARTAFLSMRPQSEGVITLSELVERQVEEFSDRFGIRVDSYVQQGPLVPSRVSIEILRVLQEALNNIRKHAVARRIVVRLKYPRNSVLLSVRDDGIGFDPRTIEGGFGRQSMHERAQSIGAGLKIASIPGRGTTVTLRVPASQLVTHR